jgi:hypothetical protein
MAQPSERPLNLEQGPQATTPNTLALVASAFSTRSKKTRFVIGAALTFCVTFLVGIFFASSKPLAETTYQGKPARHWIEQLRDKDLDARQAAATALVAIGAAAKPYSGQLETALKDGLWEAVLFMQERQRQAFTTAGIAIGSFSTPEEIRRAEEQGKAWQEENRALRARVRKMQGYLLTVLQAMDKADPDRLQAINGKVYREMLNYAY